MRLAELRGELVDGLRRIAAAGLVLGTAGNASARDRESGLIAVSPASLPYDAMAPEDVCVVGPDGAVLEGGRPSVELPMHLAIHARRPDVGGIVHTHSPYATAVALVADEIPATIPEQAATAGGPVPVAPYAPTGQPDMADAVLAAAGDRWAAVVRNHGPVCLGRTLVEALACAFAVEEAARIYALARLLGEPTELDDAEVDRVARLTARR